MYQKIQPDWYSDELVNRFNLPSNTFLPNQSDKFECHYCESCCVDKNWKIYTRQDYINHINNLLKVCNLKRINYEIGNWPKIQLWKKLCQTREFIIKFDRNKSEHMEELEINYCDIVQLVRHN
jgi:hypothetical protein